MSERVTTVTTVAAAAEPSVPAASAGVWLMLDLNGVLVHRGRKTARARRKVEPDKSLAVFTWPQGYRMWLRPHAAEFVARALRVFGPGRVGFWSSARAENNEAALAHFFSVAPLTPAMRADVAFVWNQEHCQEEPHPDPAEHKPLFVKSVANLRHTIGCGARMVVLDDSAIKFGEEDRRSVLIVPTWDGSAEDTLLCPGNPLDAYLHTLVHELTAAPSQTVADWMATNRPPRLSRR
jgi:hypothetical protein